MARRTKRRRMKKRRAAISPSRRRSVHLAEALGGAENLEEKKGVRFTITRGTKRVSLAYRKPPGER